MRLTFIIGTGRCGSTLVHEMLAKHGAAGFFSTFEERHSRFEALAGWANALYRRTAGPLARLAGRQLAPTEAYALIARRASPIYVRPVRDLTREDVTPWLRRRFTELFRDAARRAGGAVFVHKYTGWSRLGFFAEIFPEARFVHVVRDGRAVANSWLQMPWWTGYEGPDKWIWGPLSAGQREAWEANRRSFVALAGICWDKLMESYEHGSAGLGEARYMTMRYEDLLGDPEANIRRILEFSGLEWTPGFARQLGRFRIRQSRRRAFETDLTPGQVEVLEAIMGERLASYGYLAALQTSRIEARSASRMDKAH